MNIKVQTNQHTVETENYSKEFAKCWGLAGIIIQRQADIEGFSTPTPGGKFTWLKDELCPPFLEHLSFRLGNQIFLVRVEDVDAVVQAPGTRDGLVYAAQGWQGHPCIFPVKNRGGQFFPVMPRWGLVHAQTHNVVDPVGLMTDADIELTDWELHDFAIQIVRDDLQSKDRQIMSWTSNPEVNPSLWFVGDSGPEWVVVRAARYPQISAEPPDNIAEIALAASQIAKGGHFACVAFKHYESALKPICRGYPVDMEYEGLVRYTGTTERGVHGIHFRPQDEGTYRIE